MYANTSTNEAIICEQNECLYTLLVNYLCTSYIIVTNSGSYIIDLDALLGKLPVQTVAAVCLVPLVCLVHYSLSNIRNLSIAFNTAVIYLSIYVYVIPLGFKAHPSDL